MLPTVAWGSREALPGNAMGQVVKEAVRHKLLEVAGPPDGEGKELVELNPFFTGPTSRPPQ